MVREIRNVAEVIRIYCVFSKQTHKRSNEFAGSRFLGYKPDVIRLK